MDEWLWAPKRLRTPQVRAIFDAWAANKPQLFASAYGAYRKGKGSEDEQEHIASAQRGEKADMDILWGWFLDAAVEHSGRSITNATAQQLLADARATCVDDRAAIYQRLRDYLEKRVSDCATSILYPGQEIDMSQALAAPAASIGDAGQSMLTLPLSSGGEVDGAALSSSDAPGSSVTVLVSDPDPEEDAEEDEEVAPAQTQWDQLANSILGSAERMWRDAFLDRANPPQPRTLLSLARISQQLMLLWLEAILYQDRAYANGVARIMEDGTEESTEQGGSGKIVQSTRRGIRLHIDAYHEAIKGWEKELHRGIDKTSLTITFRSHQLESQQLRRLIRQFSTYDDKELGWGAQAADAQTELRYQFRDELRREYWATGHPIVSSGMYVLKITTGYGTRPLFFFRTVGILFLVDMALFFLNDFFNPGFSLTFWNAPHFCATSAPHIQQWTNYWDEFVRYAYIAITHLTSLGINSSLTSYCGGTFSEIVVVFSTVAGYFMLGLLSAMLYTLLTQSD